MDHPQSALEPTLADDAMENVRELTDVDELRVISDPRRWAIHSLLISYELNVTELAERIGEPRKRLYYHIKELERVRLIRVTRTEQRFGITEKYYRATSEWLDISPALMHLPASSAEVQAATDWYVNLLQMTAAHLRRAIGRDPKVLGNELFWASHNGIRMEPERAAELARRLGELHDEFVIETPSYPGEPYQGVMLTLFMVPLPPRRPGRPVGATELDDRSPPDE